MDGEVGQILKDVITNKGYVALDYWDAGFKQFSTNKKPIILPSDAEGQKMRIMSSKALNESLAKSGVPINTILSIIFSPYFFQYLPEL